MAKSQNSNRGKSSPKPSPKTVPVKPGRNINSNSRPTGIPKGYKPSESTHQPNPPKESGSGLKGS